MNKHTNKKKAAKGTAIIMAYASCAGSIAANIAKDCDNPLVGGYTGRGVLINLSDSPTLTVSASNPRIVSGITLASGTSCCVVDNVAFGSPLNGSGTASTDEDGFVKYDKTVVVNIPLRGAAVAQDIVEPLHSSALGFLLILEKKDKSGDGSYEIIGMEQGLKANADGVTRNEYENGGSIVATLSCRENYFESVFFATDYATTKTAFETLMASAY